MKYEVGDKVRIKDTNIEGTVESIIRGQVIVDVKGSKIPVWPEDTFLMKSVEEEISLDKAGQITDFEYEGLAYTLPEGYQFKDEHGNVINATKIVLEKKKKEYPKTYEECYCVLLERASVRNMFGYKADLMVALQKLLVCRDAYWKLYGEEMGLEKPWEPIYQDDKQDKHCIYVDVWGITLRQDNIVQHTFSFPTPEMRDAFYENFKELIEQCKELL